MLMTLAGLSMALGAFLAGVLLATREYRHALETDIEPFKGLLLGLFFIAVGMSIDFGLLLGQPAMLGLLVAGLLGLKALVLAWLAPRLGVAARAALAVRGAARAGRRVRLRGVRRGARCARPPAGVGRAADAAVALSMAPRRCCCSRTTSCSRGARTAGARATDTIEQQDGR